MYATAFFGRKYLFLAVENRTKDSMKKKIANAYFLAAVYLNMKVFRALSLFLEMRWKSVVHC